MRVALLQINPLVGAPLANADAIRNLIRQYAGKADLFVAPELALVGYPPRDLLTQQSLLRAEAEALKGLRDFSREAGVALLLGHTESRNGQSGAPLYNAASLFSKGQPLGTVRKGRLPTYDIFDEARYFEPWTGGAQGPLLLDGNKIQLQICEDGWDSVVAHGVRDIRRYGRSHGPLEADLHINLSASPYNIGKRLVREDLFCALAARAAKPVLYVNHSGAQDDILFDGASFAADGEGKIVARAPAFQCGALLLEIQGANAKRLGGLPHSEGESLWDEVAAGLESGIRDYVTKSGFSKVLVGLSGGIDSALVAQLACRALGPDKVLGVSLPSKLTSKLSKDLARDLAKNLGIELREVAIADAVAAHQKALGLPDKGLAFENLQSRNRGLVLMTLANAEGRLLLSTGNKSEIAMGYATLYGDMSGALAPIGDLYKTEVYGLAWHLNRGKEIIPAEIMSRVPTAELAPNQKDSDSLPDYPILDGILFELIENQGESRGDLKDWESLLAPRHSIAALKRSMHRQEYKRAQAAPCLRIHTRAFGSGWSMPLAKGSL